MKEKNNLQKNAYRSRELEVSPRKPVINNQIQKNQKPQDKVGETLTTKGVAKNTKGTKDIKKCSIHLPKATLQVKKIQTKSGQNTQNLTSQSPSTVSKSSTGEKIQNPLTKRTQPNAQSAKKQNFGQKRNEENTRAIEISSLTRAPFTPTKAEKPSLIKPLFRSEGKKKVQKEEKRKIESHKKSTTSFSDIEDQPHSTQK